MRLSRSAAVSKQRKNRKFGSSRAKQKHKRLDAICEDAYNQNHRSSESKFDECNDNASEVRRSSRVRRPPAVLDASPPPPKKRQKVDHASSFSQRAVRSAVQIESPCSTSKKLEQESASWRSRLRGRDKKVSFGVERASLRGKRKLFDDSDSFKELPNSDSRDLNDDIDGSLGESLMVVKSKRPGRIKASNGLSNGHKKFDLRNSDSDEEGFSECKAVDVADCLIDNGVKDDNVAMESVEQKGDEVPLSLEQDECLPDINVLHSVEQNNLVDQSRTVDQNNQDQPEAMDQNNQVGRPGTEEQVEVDQPGTVDRNNQDQPETADQNNQVGQCFNLEFGATPTDHAGQGICDDGQQKDKKVERLDEVDFTPNHQPDKTRIREGRRCGLCGGGTDGKPPRKLVQNSAGSDHEAFSGSSSQEEPSYDIWDGFGDEPGWLGRLLGPINDRFGIAGIWVHQNCAVWSPEVYFAGLGCLKNVRAALCRGRVLKCSRCGRRGATIGCRVDRCPKTYHLPCARASNCIFDHRKFLIACGDHRKLFQPKYSDMLKKMKIKKMKMEMRKLANDASRKDHEAEEKWLDNCGEDEEFLKRENRRLHRDLLRIAPVYIGGSTSENEIPSQSHGWESVGGLQDVIRCLKEVVLLPLLYPEFFDNLGLTPPRGVLLHGYPGTGKTLVVRALIGSCSHGDKRIAYFARKGADCLGKYVGDAERQLRLLFQVAEKSQPSIIFFDEIDGLAPARTRQLDQTHSSVVSTLLALLDGLKSRGSVVVIGATNRPDAIDPALRRPGRFDREIYFPLPSVKDREAILSLHTQKWPTPVSGSLLQWIARKTVGYAGADLQALCTQTAIIALKRRCPWQKFLSAAGEKTNGKRPPLPNFAVEERDWLEALSCAPPPCSRREAGMAANDVVSSPLPAHLVHCLLQPLSRLLVSIYQDERISLPPSLCKAAAAIKNIIFSALDKKKVHSNYWQSHIHDLLQQADVASDVESKLSRGSILIGDANVASFDALDVDTEMFESSKLQSRLVQTNALSSLSYAGKKSSFCVLIAGSPGSGQRHLASCILHCFAGNVVIRKVDLATISQEAGGDMVYGLTQKLMGCANVGSCVVFMPRIDLWAVKTCHQDDKEKNSGPSENLKSPGENASFQTHTKVVNEEIKSTAENCEPETLKQQDPELRPSLLWSSFVEQVESMFVSASLMILATSDIPLQLLPLRIRQFFGNDISNLSVSARMGNTIPRFSVHVDGNFNHDMVIDSCATKLSNDVARYFVQLIHHKTHTTSLKSNETSDAIEVDMDMPCHKLDPEPSTAQGSKNQHCPPPPSKKEVKGKSNLMLAISTLGYQILQYPHFSELCWVTSKLKDGPCTEISGPWKGWPFNSCIVRPNETTEKIAVASGSSTDKSKGKYGLVRGLIAIGLSAYRGAYTSLREVTADVRKVLELLVLQINAKIEMGKDRYQFIHILSQVAYLEDMVYSWAYTLRSLEKEVQLTEANPERTCDRSLNQNDNCEDHPIQDGVNKSKSPHDVQSGEYIGCLNKNGVDGSCGQLTSDFEDSNPVIREQNGNGSQPSRLGVSDYYSEVRSLNQSNGFARTDCFVSAENGPHNEVDCVGDGCSQDNGLSSAGRNIPSDYEKPNSSGNEMDTNLTANRLSGPPVDPGGICLYRICSKCLFNIYHLMQKQLIRQWEMKVYNLTADEIHDIVTSLSLNIHSAIAKFCLSKSLSISFDKIHKFGNSETLFEGQEVANCQCGTSGNRLPMAMECSCHSQSKRATAQESSSGFPRHELDSEFIYRDGVLVVLDPEKDVSFHCKFQAICLCSFIEYIVMTKQPSD